MGYSLFILLLFISLNFVSRYLAVDYLGMVGEGVSLQALTSDFLVAVFGLSLFILINKVNRWIALIVLLWPIAHFANLESIIALNKPINLMDLHYGGDGDFLSSSLASLSFPILYLGFILVFLVAFLRIRWGHNFNFRYTFVLFAGSTLGTFSLALDADTWQESNPLALSVVQYVMSDSAEDGLDYSLQDSGSFSGFENEVNSNNQTSGINTDRVVALESRSRAEIKPNLLLVVLEGIPGAYITSIQDYFDLPRSNLMPNLSRIAETSQIIPSFVTHSQQTIRGLYSMLCGDYSKQSLTTPKSLEYLQLDTHQRKRCLPKILADTGYRTSYLQAADLAFMSKDQFMSAIGFQDVNGKNWFSRQYIPFGWGPDDMAFFEQAVDKITQLDTQPEPWFLTLLTIGTHHPYAVPDKLAQHYVNRKQAAVAYLDRALGPFMDRLNQMGVPKDTLIIFTSDESHGVKGQPYGNNWGLNLMMGVGIKPGIHSGIYGLSDLSISILDYLGLSEKGSEMIGRSLFRHYDQPRSMLFHSVMGFQLEHEGSVVGCNSAGNCSRYETQNGKLFSAKYNKMELAGSDSDSVKKRIQASAYHVDKVLAEGRKKGRNRLALLSQSSHRLSPNQMAMISGGQIINVPPSSKVTISLKLRPEVNRNNDGASLFLDHKGFIGQGEYQKEVRLNYIRLPTLNNGEQLELRYNFYAEKGLTNFSPNLYAGIQGRSEAIIEGEDQSRAMGRALATDKEALIVDEFNVIIEPQAIPSPFGVEQFAIVKGKQRLGYSTTDAGTYFISSRYKLGGTVQFSPNSKGAGFQVNGWSIPEDSGTWTEGEKAVLAFVVDSDDIAAQGYQLQLGAQAYVNKKNPEQKVELLLNDHFLGTVSYSYPDSRQELNISVPAVAVREGLNQFTLNIEKPTSPKSLGLSDDGRELGIHIYSFKLLKNG
ncbi:LTA synthase family protein [Motiliproteus sp. MSK22-1]|uniref:LTA synthase family protein n=1 Tax=Motiliproteus sp. MSK22-1 TaxID=1897630 RepID=UPI000977E24B|nr:LTA synthase family protein [Motiliproteus sp. MSK22-1]OMH33613.1 hypothetical protein BGP75_11360 [Motiliproteus sp. MSK22-1]